MRPLEESEHFERDLLAATVDLSILLEASDSASRPLDSEVPPSKPFACELRESEGVIDLD